MKSRKIIGIMLIIATLFAGKSVSASSQPREILNKYSFTNRVNVEYVNRFNNYRVKANVTTTSYKDKNKKNTYLIRLLATPYTDEQKQLFLHELGHIIQREYKVDLERYMIFVHGHEKFDDNGEWKNKASEAFAEDIKVYLSKKIYNIKTTNTTNYKYNRRVGWFLARNGIKLY